MYGNNSQFCRLFLKYFSDENKFKIFPKSGELIRHWKSVNKNPQLFLKQMEVNNKLHLYRWIYENYEKFLDPELELAQSITLDTDSCQLIFGSDTKVRDAMWYLWKHQYKNDPVKFARCLGIKHKVCLTLWQDDDEPILESNKEK